jgi:multicomponent Na+:H+ antiporter subunit C
MDMAVIVHIWILSSVSIYLLLSRNTIRICIGLAVQSYPLFLLLLSSSKLLIGAEPIIADGRARYADPLPQAFILTAIVISFGVLVFVIARAAWDTFRQFGTTDVSEATKLGGEE